MPVKILMPALSPTMTEGTLAKWHKKEGDQVKAGQVIAEIETDKATMEVEAVDEGTMGKIVVPAGTANVKVNSLIALLLEEGEDKSALDKAASVASAPAPAPKPAAPAAPAAPKPAAQAAAAAPAPAKPAAPVSSGGDRVIASPLARRMAEQSGLNLGSITGSGPGGRIVKHDIEAALSAPGRPAAAAAPAAAASAPRAEAQRAEALGMPAYTEIPNNNIRKVVARRLTEAKQQAPHFYLTIDCEIDALLKLREQLNAKSPKEGDGAYKLSVNDMVIKLAAAALRKVPAANASYTEAAIRRYHDVDISVAVAIPDGLITPIIKRADQKGLIQISNEMKDLASRARANKLKPEEFQGGTFSISNLGMYGIREFAAVINPPQGAILAVGAGEQRPVVRQGALAIATVMTVTLSVDHRVVDGAVGAEYLQAFKKLVEDPISMLL
ncbi:MAG: pyruvate dehydrogenase complex dihydrolipoamide acetyltransferase [Alphaproteobacteria bacterium]|nr:pyruvate dehydrogenase complex dihydrolipoamide acetyltransferase [Alphaproteobacteria bacterium]